MDKELAENTKQIDSSRRLSTLALHVLFVGIIFVLPEALLRVAIPDRTLEITWPMYAKSFITLAVFYLNYFLVIPHTLNGPRGSRWKFLMWNFVIIVAGATLIYIVYRWLYSGPRPRNWQTSALAAFSYIIRDTIVLVLAISLAVALRVSRRWLDLEQRHQHLMAVRRQSELDSLRSQLNPHFLFNTLNTIYALVEISPRQAQEAIHRMSSLLRYVVYDNPRVVPLGHEIDFVTNYVELMRLRLGNRPVELSIVRSEDDGVEIAPLLFITLIENAFKHGNATDPSNPIKISIVSDGHEITCSTENFVAPENKNVNSGGVGLVNLRRRIELLYGRKALLTTELSAEGIYYASLTVDTHTNPLLP